MDSISFLNAAELNAEGLYVTVDILNTDQFAFNDALQEDTDQPHHPILVDLRVIVVLALVHTVLQEYLDKLLR